MYVCVSVSEAEGGRGGRVLCTGFVCACIYIIESKKHNCLTSQSSCSFTLHLYHNPFSQWQNLPALHVCVSVPGAGEWGCYAQVLCVHVYIIESKKHNCLTSQSSCSFTLHLYHNPFSQWQNLPALQVHMHFNLTSQNGVIIIHKSYLQVFLSCYVSSNILYLSSA